MARARKLVSRATASRYFPTQESLLLDVANVKALLKPVEDLVASFPTDDAAQRLTALAGTFTQAILSDETLIRTGERIYTDTWLANQPDGSHAPVRAGRRMRYVDEALRPLGERLSEPGRNRLRCALALALGTHAVIAMKDSAGLEDDGEIVATLEWAAGALLRTALHDFEQPQYDQSAPLPARPHHGPAVHVACARFDETAQLHRQTSARDDPAVQIWRRGQQVRETSTTGRSGKFFLSLRTARVAAAGQWCCGRSAGARRR